MSLKKIVCEHCGGQAEFRKEKNKQQLYFCSRCGEYTTIDLTKIMSEPQRLLKELKDKYGNSK